jgi:putative pyruvate formate lyase activating enzyme
MPKRYARTPGLALQSAAISMASQSEPSSLAVHRSGALAERVHEALTLLGAPCRVCPRLCSVDRSKDERGLCRIGRRAMVASYFPHFGEEDCLRGWRGSGTIFFSGCNLRCVFCLPPETLVATVEGPCAIRHIFDAATDEIALGDGAVRRAAGVRVHTVTGELAPVSKAFRRPHRGELVRLKAANAPMLRLTPNHEVFAAHRSDPDHVVKVPAGSLTRDHYLVVPKLAAPAEEIDLQVEAVLAEHVSAAVRAPRRRVDENALVSALAAPRTSREIASDLGYHPTYVRRLRSKLRAGTLVASPSAGPRSVRTENGSVRFAGEHRPGIPGSLPLDEELSWLLGFYCAEGHVTRISGRPNSYRLVFSSGKHEEKLVRHVARQLSRLFGVTPSIVERRTTRTVEVGKTSLALLFSTLCGTGARAKRVPAQIFEAPDAVLRAFLDGYLAGDGTETPTHRVANTVSSGLAHGLYQLGLRLDVLPSIHRWVPPPRKTIEGRSVRQAPLWYVKFKRDRLNGAVRSSERARWRDSGAHFLVPIQSLEREPYEGDVYNLEVDHATHSYLAPAVAVANCQNFDVSWKVQGEEVSSERLAGMMLDLQEHGCHNINWVTPEHVVPQILEALPLALDGGLRLPIVYNTSSYDSPDSLRLMAGVVDVYMPDVKLWTREHARRYLGKREYADVMRANVKEMHRQVGDLVLDDRGLARRGLIVRHLVMPGLVDETEAILRFVADELGPDTYVNLMGQYYPAGRTDKYEEIDRRPHRDELERAFELADGLGLKRLDPRSRRQALAAA